MLLQASTKLMATGIHDYPEWHHGRVKYGLWYIEINQPELIEYLEQLQQAFSDLLIPSNQRQYHITLFVAGFLTAHIPNFDDDFEMSKLNRQIKNLEALQLDCLELEVTGIDSFSSALFLQIHDKQNILSKIRQQLSLSSTEIAAPEYCPHITLGLYRKAWNSELILERIQKLQPQKFKIQVRHLTFGYYKAQILQGLLYPYYRLSLG
ncbi:2'-5' RNA ligase family protein [Acinetobacter sp. 2JN-4]|uniref:2'-5' RNA ligase family protein n=1 Tax=Acinetobacter sp. 2JN-4 TaxID=2479844 RepID=UPI00148B615C|nr:2'-5' RNA ligase family protein [Acinetobacter sp. 2JN-4]